MLINMLSQWATSIIITLPFLTTKTNHKGGQIFKPLPFFNKLCVSTDIYKPAVFRRLTNPGSKWANDKLIEFPMAIWQTYKH